MQLRRYGRNHFAFRREPLPTTVSRPRAFTALCPRMDDGRKHAACTVHSL